MAPINSLNAQMWPNGHRFRLTRDLKLLGSTGDEVRVLGFGPVGSFYILENVQPNSPMMGEKYVLAATEVAAMHRQGTSSKPVLTVSGALSNHTLTAPPNFINYYYDSDLTSSPEKKAAPAVPKVHKVAFESVVIDDAKREQILEALEQIHQQDLIFNKWGFHETIEKGKGVSLLFFGPPGTGKTLMAQAIADQLDYKLKVISTAEIESSEPGAAERNIRAQFAGAKKKGKTILLFDECDSLIYDRSGVGSILASQVNELLSSLEKYDGITIFTTNRLGTLDEAFNRRLALKLKFDLPNREQRAKIWERMFPKKAPVHDDVDWYRLAVVEISGGYIKNAVLRAVRIAAAEKIPNKQKKIKMAHLVKALKLEAESMVEFQEARNAMPMRAGPLGAGASLGKSRGDISKEIGRTIEAINHVEREESEDE